MDNSRHAQVALANAGQRDALDAVRNRGVPINVMGNSDQPPTTHTVRRRGVLKAGLIGTAVLALGGISLAMRGTLMRAKPGHGLRVLNAKEYSVLVAIADRICPAAGEGAPGASAIGIAATIDQQLANAEKDVQGAIKLLLGVFENALTGALFGERLAPFTQLDPQAQDRVLTQWRASACRAWPS